MANPNRLSPKGDAEASNNEKRLWLKASEVRAALAGVAIYAAATGAVNQADRIFNHEVSTERVGEAGEVSEDIDLTDPGRYEEAGGFKLEDPNEEAAMAPTPEVVQAKPMEIGDVFPSGDGYRQFTGVDEETGEPQLPFVTIEEDHSRDPIPLSDLDTDKRQGLAEGSIVSMDGEYWKVTLGSTDPEASMLLPVEVVPKPQQVRPFYEDPNLKDTYEF